jgi:hypothetical protein
MNHFSTQDNNKASRTLFMVMAFILLSIGTSFGQTATENNTVQTTIIENNNIVNTTIEINSVKQEATSAASNMNFVLWFMGSKQTPNATVLPIGTTAKRQFMTSGTAPNRLLIKAFLKKAINFECAVV